MVSAAVGRIRYSEASAQSVDKAVRSHQADCSRAVGERLDSQVPTRAPLRIDRQLRLLIRPVAEFATGPGVLSDAEVRSSRRCDPPMAAERQRRPLDPPSEQPVTKITVKALQGIDVDCALINPDPLYELSQPRRAQSEKGGLIQVGEPIVLPLITIGRATLKRPAVSRYPIGHRSVFQEADQLRVTPSAA